jgi:hypothetical protein
MVDTLPAIDEADKYVEVPVPHNDVEVEEDKVTVAAIEVAPFKLKPPFA